LFVSEDLEILGRRLGLAIPEAERLLVEARKDLNAVRATRPVPFIDRSRYANWNGMLAGAMIRAGVVLDDPAALGHALKPLTRLREEQTDPDSLTHSPDGQGGLLDDQVQVARASLDAFEATGSAEWLTWCQAIMDRVWREYLDPEHGGLWDTAA